MICALLTFFGWYGAYKGSPGLLYLYGAIIVSLSFVQIFAIFQFANFSAQLDAFMPNLTETYHLIIKGEDGPGKEALGDIHQIFQCCGWSDTTFTILPKSCCPGKNVDLCTDDEKFPQQCAPILRRLVVQHSTSIIATCSIVLLIELIAVVASCGMARVLRLSSW